MPSTSQTARKHASFIQGLEVISYRSSERFPKHSHEEFGIGVIRDGAHTSWSGIGQVEAEQGDAIMVNPGEIHDGAPLGKQPRSWQMIYFDPVFFTTAMENEGIASFEVIRPVARDRHLVQHFDSLLLALTHPMADILRCEERITALLGYLSYRHTTLKPRESGLPSVIAAKRQIDEAPEQRLTLAALARTCGLSRYQFLRAFHSTFGITPHAYLVQKRIQSARALLLRGVTLTDAAAQTGFADQSHLTRCFTRQYGISPGRYIASA